MYGWRGQLGLIVTSSDGTSEAEYSRYSPDGISVQAARMLLEDGVADAATLEQMSQDTEACAARLATADVDVIAYACTAGSLIKGIGFEEEIERRISDVADVPAVATAAAIKRAFETLDMNSIGITTPYIEELNQREREFLEGSGYEVVDIEGLGYRTDSEICGEPPETAYREAQKLDCRDADGVFISCTGYRTFEIIEQLEQDLGVPVVTSNQATLWDALRKMNVDYSEVELGTLFNH
jgi:maleate isomerase